MSMIWKNYTPEKEFILPVAVDSSGVEMWGGDKRAYVNPLIRFSMVFQPVYQLTREQGGSKELGCVENLIFHWLALLDQKLGMDYNSFLDWLYADDIEHGYYGEQCREMFSSIPYESQRIILRHLRYYRQNEERTSQLENCIVDLFPKSRIYFHSLENKYLIYLPYEATPCNRTLLELTVFLFLDVNFDWELFWQEHFGIIGREQTMHIDQMIIY